MINENEYSIISSLPLFDGLERSILEGLLEHSQPRSFGKGEMLFHRGDPADCFYILFDGWVKVFRETANGDEAVLGVFTRGETVAEAAAFLGRGYPASAQVVDDAHVLPVLSGPFRRNLETIPDVAMNMLASMSKRMHHLVMEVEQLKTSSATQRLVEFLLRRCAVEEGPAVNRLPYDKTLISQRLGMKPESLSRIFAKLRKLGVKTEQNQVVIMDVAVLANDFQAETLSQRISS